MAHGTGSDAEAAPGLIVRWGKQGGGGVQRAGLGDEAPRGWRILSAEILIEALSLYVYIPSLEMTEKLISVILIHENTPYFLISPIFETLRRPFPLCPDPHI